MIRGLLENHIPLWYSHFEMDNVEKIRKETAADAYCGRIENLADGAGVSFIVVYETANGRFFFSC